MIRFGKSSQQTIKNSKKPDNLEILTLIDNCTLIFKEDRIVLRNMIKDGNQDLITILNHYKKINNPKEMQTELRKYLRKKGEKENEKAPLCQSPTSNKNQKLFLQQPQQFQNSQKKSCPDLWKLIDTSSPKIINLTKTKEQTNDVQLSEIILSDRYQNESKDIEKTEFYTSNSQQHILHQQLQPKFDKSEMDLKNDQEKSQIQYSQNQQILDQEIDLNQEDDDIQSESSNESILKQMTEPPLQQIQIQTSKNDIKPTQLFSSRESSYTQNNTINSYVQPAIPQTIEKISSAVKQTNYSFFNYQDCQQMAQQQYKHLFTHWPTLLHKLDKPDYVPNYKSVLYIDTTPEHIFTLLFPDSAYLRINYFQFQNLLKQIPFQIDCDELFKVLPKQKETFSIIQRIENLIILQNFIAQKYRLNCFDVFQKILVNYNITVI